MADDKIDFSKYLAAIRSESAGRANEEESRQAQPERETRPQAQKEKLRDWFARVQPADGERSDWSGSGWGGGNMAGHNWAGGRQR